MAVRITNTRYYPKYHIAAPGGWINDPNGFCYFKGKYHLFYQYHPHSTQWGPMHWGHVVSDDLINWSHLPIALAPVDGCDRDGCFSGSAIEKDGQLYLFYTGHLNTPEHPEGFRQVQNFAVGEDGVHFSKSLNNPVITVPEDEEIHRADFRDPKVWKNEETGKYYMVVGSRVPDNVAGQVLLFESDDLLDWKFKSIMARVAGNEGFMWECPNFANVEGHDILMMSPQGIKRELNKYMNVYQSGYFMGNFDYETGVFTRGEFELLDYGFDFYAPQITELPDGRTIMIAWADMWQSPMPEQEDGWAGMMTVPREIHVKGGKIVTPPVKELEKLRTSKKVYEDLAMYKATKLDGVSGETGELILDIDLTETNEFEIYLRASEDKTQKTVISYNKALELFKVNRDESGAGVDGERECTIAPADKMKLQIFLDRSSIEIFINDGEKVMSVRVYPETDSTDIVFVPKEGGLKIDSLNFYELGVGIPQPVID